MTNSAFTALSQLRIRLEHQIVGQQDLVNKLLIALIADGHLLVEGAPGLAKTRAIRELAAGMEADFQRIQFTPDLLPGDVTGTEIFRPQTGEFEYQAGPIAHNLVLADEINRAPAKVQAALLEAMAERQVSVGKATYPLPELFLVMATQNPIEQEGTYPLPEAQLDRFLMKVVVGYPSVQDEKLILRLVRQELVNESDKSAKGSSNDTQSTNNAANAKIQQSDVFAARQQSLQLHLSEAVEEYIVQLVAATRDPAAYDETLSRYIEYGASPRASLALERCARAVAWLDQRDFVTPDDVQSVAHDVLRHRIIVSFEAEAKGVDSDSTIQKLLECVPVL